MTWPVGLALVAYVVTNLVLLLTLSGAAVMPDQSTGTKIWASLIVLCCILWFNAFALDNLGRYFGI